MPIPQSTGPVGAVSEITAVPFASEVLFDTLVGNVWKTRPKKLGQLPVPSSVPQTRATHLGHSHRQVTFARATAK